MKKQLYRAAAATVLGLSLTTGMVAADTGNINTTGPNSYNEIKSVAATHNDVDNDNDLAIHNDNDQEATSGEVSVEHNTTGGNATSGSASNANALSASVSVDNSASGAMLGGSSAGSSTSNASISNTGPSSTNTVKSEVYTTNRVSNDNDLYVYNDNDQEATSGDVSVENNTTGGSATSGSATNSSTSTFNFTVKN